MNATGLLRLAPRCAALAVVASALAACGGGDPPAPAAPVRRAAPTTPRSLVLVDLSGVRYEEVVPAGDAVPAASAQPVFRALEKDGAFFTQATASAAWDTPSIAGILTGLSPDQCTVNGRPADGVRAMIPAIETLAEMLSEAGYATAAFTAGGRIARYARLDQGFQVWEEVVDDAARLARARAWLGGLAKDRPRFLFLHAALTLESAPPTTADRPNRLAALDRWLGEARALADATRPRDDAWFVALSDHGDVRFDREGGLDPGDTGVSDGLVRVPVAVVGPGFRPGPIDASVTLLDLVPTVRDLIGLEPLRVVEGHSWRPLLDGRPSEGRAAITQGWRRVSTPSGRTNQHVIGVRVPAAKFAAAFDKGTGRWVEELFDLRADPRELSPLAATDLARFGEAFAQAVEVVRTALKGGQKIYDDPLTGPYVHR